MSEHMPHDGAPSQELYKHFYLHTYIHKKLEAKKRPVTSNTADI